MYNFLCPYSCHAFFILSHKSEKRVTERNKNQTFDDDDDDDDDECFYGTVD